MNMFGRKPKASTSQVDELNRKKVASKVLDVKKDLKDRFRHLKSFIETTADVGELKQFFDANYSQIYFIFYESFVNVEGTIKQKMNRATQQDLRDILLVFMKILLLQPERLHQRWQIRSIGRIIQKLIHVGNTKSIRFHGTQLFLIWYQILNSNKTHVEELMFQRLIQGFEIFYSPSFIGESNLDHLNNSLNLDQTSTSHVTGKSICPFEINPIIPIQPNEHPIDSANQQQLQQGSSNSFGIYNLTAEMLEKVLKYMQEDCMLIEWSGDKQQHSQRCYEFLFDEFKRYYLSHMFPNAFIHNSARNYSTSPVTSQNIVNQQNSSLNVYSNIDLINLLNDQPMPTFERPILASIGSMTTNDERKLTQLHCKEEIIKWLISVLLIESPLSHQNSTGNTPSTASSGIGSSIQTDHYSTVSSIGTLVGNLYTFDNGSINNRSYDQETLKSSNQDDVWSHNDLDSHDTFSSMSINTSTTSISTITAASSVQQTNFNKKLLQRVILSSVTNVNLVHEILKNTYFLNFEDSKTVQQVLKTYKTWFLNEAKMPTFMQEPLNPYPTTPNSNSGQISGSTNDLESPMSSSIVTSDFENEKSESWSVTSVNYNFKESISGETTRIGYMRCLQIFFYHSSNLLLNRNNFQREKINKVCCYTLEIYKLFIQNIKMDNYTWTMLITILLKVAEFIFNSEYLANNRHETATSQLIKLMTETMLLAIVKASFTFSVNFELWDQLMLLLSSVSSNSDVIDKWIEVIDDVIRQVFKTSYQIDINNMPIDSKLDKKGKLKNKKLYPQNGTSNTAVTLNNHHQALTISASNLANSLAPQNMTKQRSKTEIYSPSNFNPIVPTNQNLIQTNQTISPTPSPRVSKVSKTDSSQPMSITGQNQISNNGLASPTINNPPAGNERSCSTSVPPTTLTRQPSTKIQNTFRDDTYLHTLGNLTLGDIDSAKSPSLSGDQFLGINNKANNNNDTTQNSHSPRGNSHDLSSQNSSSVDDTENVDSDIDLGDKSATLKASQQVNTTSTHPKIDRFNSDKSIYYSSEVLAESNSNNISLSSNDSSSQLNNISLTFSPSVTSSLPPVLPPLPTSSSKISPPSQRPPPLPPLPPALASKYALKTALYLECNEQVSNNSIKPISCETSSLDSDGGGTEHVDSADFRADRQIKCTSTCSDIDVFLKDSHVNTPSEGASMSGNDFSGEIYTSPTSNNEHRSKSNTDMIQVSNILQANSSSSLLMPTINTPTTENYVPQLIESNSNSPDASGLLVIDSGIDNRYSNKERQEHLSRSSTLTPGMTAEFSNVTEGYEIEPPTTNKNNSELIFKETANCLIKRLFGCLGNVNAIKDPLIHKRVFEFIYNKWDKLNKIKDILKLNDLSKVIPSITYFSPWLFEAIYQLSANYQSGKLIAYKILCKIVIRSVASGGMWNLANQFDLIDDEFMNLFYMTIHQGLNCDNKNVINCIIQNCGPKFWHCMLPSCTLLLKDFIDACGSIDREGPKYEAASILGCLIGFPDYFGDMQILNKPSESPGNLDVENYTKESMKNLIIHNLTNFSDEINNTSSRCVILCSLTCFIYDEILNQRWHPRLNDAIKRIFKDLDFRESFNPVLVKMSCDNLRFLSVLATPIFQYEIQYAINIINELNQCLVKLINSKQPIVSDEYEKAIIANMFALLEWCMNMPLEKLKDNDRGTLLRNNFKLIIHICNTFKSSESSEAHHIHLAARFIIQHLLTQLNHFPFGSTGPSKIVTSVNETSDLGLNLDELSPILFDQSNIQFFTVNNQFLISLIELPMKGNEHYFNMDPNFKTSSTICRFIIRDFCGKNCWDCCILRSPEENLPNTYMLDIPSKNMNPLKADSEKESNENEKTDVLSDSNNNSFDFKKLPFLQIDEIPKDLDILDNILKFVSFSSPECSLEPNKPLNIVWDVNTHLNSLLNVDEVKEKLLTQSKLEQSHTDATTEIEHIQLDQENIDPNQDQTKVLSYFHLCKSFVHQMGLLSWEKRTSFNILKKNSQLLRELKSLDDQTCRETHKIALIYIAEGQDDKMSILSNESGSEDYEYFLSKLAWSVDLESHEGFMGGLQHNYQLKTAPYYANSCCEVLFHVSTQMNMQNDQNKISKWRHLGNDSVQIIWSEHTKDYDRSILATEFADVIICIYPLRNELYRIKITKKQSVGYFGPLFDGAVVNKQALPTLIRTTAINASRILLSNTKGYQDFFVHRAHAISNIIKSLTLKQTFEEFIGGIYLPETTSTSNGQINISAGLPTSTLNIPSSSQNSQTLNHLQTGKKDSQDSSYNF